MKRKENLNFLFTIHKIRLNLLINWEQKENKIDVRKIFRRTFLRKRGIREEKILLHDCAFGITSYLFRINELTYFIKSHKANSLSFIIKDKCVIF